MEEKKNIVLEVQDGVIDLSELVKRLGDSLNKIVKKESGDGKTRS